MVALVEPQVPWVIGGTPRRTPRGNKEPLARLRAELDKWMVAQGDLEFPKNPKGNPSRSKEEPSFNGSK